MKKIVILNIVGIALVVFLSLFVLGISAYWIYPFLDVNTTYIIKFMMKGVIILSLLIIANYILCLILTLKNKN